MCDKEEIPSLAHSDATVDDRARLNIAVVFWIGILLIGRVEAVVMVLANNNEGDVRLGCTLKDFRTSSSDCRYLLA